MKKLSRLAVMLALVLALSVPAFAAQDSHSGADTGTLKIAVMSDDHYLSPSMIRDTADYTTALNSDRKMFAESDAILRTMLDAVRQDKPDVLLISGDLTKDGEQECHKALAKQLQQLQQMPAMLHAVRLDITRYELLDGALRADGYAARQVLDLG